MKKTARFERTFRGQSTFQCEHCKRTTREVDGNASVGLCPQCSEALALENGLNDYADSIAPDERTATLAKIDHLFREAVKRGGSIDGITKETP
jgi:hypothetical protein